MRIHYNLTSYVLYFQFLCPAKKFILFLNRVEKNCNSVLVLTFVQGGQGSALPSWTTGLCVSIDAQSIRRHNSSVCIQGCLHRTLPKKGDTLKQETLGSDYGPSKIWNINEKIKRMGLVGLYAANSKYTSSNVIHFYCIQILKT